MPRVQRARAFAFALALSNFLRVLYQWLARTGTFHEVMRFEPRAAGVLPAAAGESAAQLPPRVDAHESLGLSLLIQGRESAYSKGASRPLGRTLECGITPAPTPSDISLGCVRSERSPTSCKAQQSGPRDRH
jgi:hypothetical protein